MHTIIYSHDGVEDVLYLDDSLLDQMRFLIGSYWDRSTFNTILIVNGTSEILEVDDILLEFIKVLSTKIEETSKAIKEVEDRYQMILRVNDNLRNQVI